ncbi:MAG: TadE/TadG family type IV pilus assembly protein [Thiohalorhabdus sp.]|uniref:TadE/TadG family type IV pilus assembly protein n=1 Tax=Thiohalorhabdus sp. TaxID=3094134 RepID=UPI0039814D02
MNRQPAFEEERGAALVELALVFPLLMLLLVGVVELGRGLYQSHILTKAVESGARYLSREPGALDWESCDTGETWGDGVQRASRLVVYGDPFGGEDPLVPNLGTDAVTVNATAPGESEGEGLAGSPCVVRVRAEAAFEPVVAPGHLPGLADLVLVGTAEERYVGE